MRILVLGGTSFVGRAIVTDALGAGRRRPDVGADTSQPRVGRYLFISSHAVYATAGVAAGSDEDTPRRPPVRDTEEIGQDTYGPLKTVPSTVRARCRAA